MRRIDRVGTTDRRRRFARPAVVLLVAASCTAGDGRDAASVPRLGSCEVVAPDLRGAPPAEPVVVTFWHSERDSRWDLLWDLVREFDRAHPGITVELEDAGGGRRGVLEHWRATAPENRPSLALMAGEATRLLADSGQTVAPGPCLTEAIDDLLPKVEAEWSVDGVAQAVPLAVEAPVLVYNRRLFEAAGLDPDDPPATMAEFRTAAERLQQRADVAVPVLFDTADAAGAWLVELWNAGGGALSLSPGNGRDASAERAVWDEGPAVEMLAQLGDMAADGLVARLEHDETGVDDLLASIGERPRTAMVIDLSGGLGKLRHVLGSPAEASAPGLDVAPLPGSAGGAVPFGAGLWLAAGKAPAEVQAAWSLAVFLASPDVQARWWASAGYVPVSRTAVGREPLRSTLARQPELAVAYGLLEGPAASPAEAGMSAGPESQLRLLLTAAVDDVLDGGDAATALQNAADDADGLLATYTAHL